jgi:diketogulonate reductase-like aldo/keto reductase
MLTIESSVELANGVRMPRFGLGVWRSEPGEETERAVAAALRHGYRLVDTAALYGNEADVGRAVRASGIPREQIFVTTKVWNDDHGYDNTKRAFHASLDRLGMEYVDLYLIHWPVPARGLFKETYRAIEDLYEEGLIRAIGVSNFKVHHLEELMASCRVKPMVNQIELHPLLTQRETVEFCRREGIQIESWSPIMRGKLDIPLLHELAEKYGKTPAQIVIRWHLQHGYVVIPKSVREERIAENSRVFDFELAEEDMRRIDGLNEDRRFGRDPDAV